MRSSMVFGRDVSGDIITRSVDFMETIQAAQEYANLARESVFIFEGAEFVAEIVPNRECGGCGSQDIGPTDVACAMCTN